MKKIGILTFAWSQNYGAKLQAWALQNVLISLGYNCEIINYKRKDDIKLYKIIKLIKQGFFKRLVNELIIDIYNWRKTIRFKSFTNNKMQLSPISCTNLPELEKEGKRYYAIICGSDQIWNPELTKESQPAYLLDFSEMNKMLRISYAASLGKDFIEESMLGEFSRCLKKFDAISVREESVVELIKDMSEKEVTTTLDPTLLISREKWIDVINDENVKSPYLLIYSFAVQPKLKIIAEQIAKERGLKIVHFHKRSHYKYELFSYPSAGPGEFLNLFSKAEFVVTNSFHGTAFSIIFQKPFFSLVNNNRGSRIKDLLNALCLTERLILDDFTKEDRFKEIDYNKVELKLVLLKKKSMEFLKAALKVKK